MINYRNRYYANYIFVHVLTKFIFIMKQKLSLSGVNLYISILFCDVNKPIYSIEALFNGDRVSVCSNSISLPEGCEDVRIFKLSESDIRSYLLHLRDNFECDTFAPYNKFRSAFLQMIENRKIESNETDKN